jgi:hypothetical protein
LKFSDAGLAHNGAPFLSSRLMAISLPQHLDAAYVVRAEKDVALQLSRERGSHWQLLAVYAVGTSNMANQVRLQRRVPGRAKRPGAIVTPR